MEDVDAAHFHIMANYGDVVHPHEADLSASDMLVDDPAAPAQNRMHIERSQQGSPNTIG